MPSDLHTIKINADVPLETFDQDSNETVAEDQIFNKHTETSSFLPQCLNVQLEKDAIQKDFSCEDKINWPTIGQLPINEHTTPFLATMAFPTLFPDGNGDPTNPSLNRDISLSSKIQHLMKFAELINSRWVYRFATHPRFSYWA